MRSELQIYFDETVSDELLDDTEKMLKKIYSPNYRVVGIRIPSKMSWKDENNAFDGRLLLEDMIREGLVNFLWIIDSRIVIEDNNVFGFAERMKGAVIATKDLYIKNMLIAIEATCLVGVVFGLNYCENECLMRKSDTLEILLQKPNTLCDSCNAKFLKLKQRL